MIIKSSENKDIVTIPKGASNINISIKSDKDVDLRLYDKSKNISLVSYPDGKLGGKNGGANLATVNYDDINIKYSGYNGTNSKLGHEFINITESIPNDFTLNAYAYKKDLTASINYSWNESKNENCNVNSLESSGEKTLSVLVEKGSSLTLGEIPIGVENLYITTKPKDKKFDIDINLYSKNKTIIAYPDGLINSKFKKTITYNNMPIEYSGYFGYGGESAGNEYLKITDKTKELLTVKIFNNNKNFEADVEITYKWGSKCKLKQIDDDSSFKDDFIEQKHENIFWAGGDLVQDIESGFNNARVKDSTVKNKKLAMPSQTRWNDMSIDEKALYLINQERYSRGLKPFEGIETGELTKSSTDYATVLYNKGVASGSTKHKQTFSYPVYNYSKNCDSYDEDKLPKYECKKNCNTDKPIYQCVNNCPSNFTEKCGSGSEKIDKYIKDNDKSQTYTTIWERLDLAQSFVDYQDLNSSFNNKIKNDSNFGEAIYFGRDAYSYETITIEKAIYSWLYEDKGDNWQNRKLLLANNLNDEDKNGVEGLVSLGAYKGNHYGDPEYNYWKVIIFVMNIFDPSSKWDSTKTSTVDISNCN